MSEEKIRPSIAREWKIKEDLELGKGKANDKGELRSTVAGEIAYDEVLKRTENGNKSPLKTSNFIYATMNLDTEVTSDFITKEDRKIRDKHREKLKNDKEYTTTTDILIDFTPAGKLKDLYESIVGEKFLSGEKLSEIERLALLTSSSKALLHLNNLGKNLKEINENIQKEEKNSLQRFSNKEINKELHEKINSRKKEYFLNLQADKNVNKITAPIDFENHIINAEIKKDGKYIVGGHSNLGNVRIDEIKNVYKNRVYEAKISVQDSNNSEVYLPKINNDGISTMFPSHWTKNRLKVEVDWAYKNKIIIENTWIGKTPSGVDVKGFLEPKTTVYPIEK